MVLKAFVIKLPQSDDNMFKVRIPFLEDNTTNEMVFDALLCNQPGEYNGYNVGDCVFVSFENDKLNTPIILGKLYVNQEGELPTYHILNELNVTSRVTLPENTTIGNYTLGDILNSAQQLGNVTIVNQGGNSSSTTIGDLKYDIINVW